MIIDIRKEQKEEVTGIKFDNSDDVILWNNEFLSYGNDDEVIISLCKWEDFDNFIAALYKAKELAGK